jgi:erythromycin esterase
MKQIYFLVFLIALPDWYGCSNPEREIRMSFNQVIAPLPEGSPLKYEDQYLENLAPWDQVAIIGLGEATHGTMDFVELRQRLFRFLVEQHDCRVLAYEYSYRKSLLVNDYIHHRYHELDSLFKGDLWIQDNDTLRQFIAWMRSYNAGKEKDQQISFVGIDNQVDAMHLDDVLDQIASCLPALEFDHVMIPYNVAGKGKIKYQDMNEADYKLLKNAFIQLKDLIKKYRLSLSLQEDKDQARVALQLANALEGSHEFLYQYYAGGKNIRDHQLAGNVLRLLDEGDDKGKVVVWAHNAHVAINSHYTPEGLPAMGWYLREAIGKRYLSVGTSFSKGRFTAVMLDSLGNDTAPMTCRIQEDPPPESFNSLFQQALYPQFTFSIRDLVPGSELYRYFDQEKPLIGVGDLYLGSPELNFTNDRIINLAKAHDLLFYYSDTAPLLR